MVDIMFYPKYGKNDVYQPWTELYHWFLIIIIIILISF